MFFIRIPSQVGFFTDAIAVDPRPLTIAAWICFFCYAFQMPLLFFIAGYFAVPSLDSKGISDFIRSKLLRLLIPGILVLVFLNPIHRYLFHLSRSFESGIPPMNYFEYLPYFFGSMSWFRIESLSLAEFSILHLWFVNLLFLFFIGYVLMVALVRMLCRSKVNPSIPVHAEYCTRGQVLTQMAIAGCIAWLACAVILMIAESFEWVTFATFFPMELPSVAFHLIFFALGIRAYRCNWFAEPETIGSVWVWLAISVPTMIAVIIFDEFTGARCNVAPKVSCGTCLLGTQGVFNADLSWLFPGIHDAFHEQDLQSSSSTGRAVISCLPPAFRGGLVRAVRLFQDAKPSTLCRAVWNDCRVVAAHVSLRDWPFGTGQVVCECDKGSSNEAGPNNRFKRLQSLSANLNCNRPQIQFSDSR